MSIVLELTLSAPNTGGQVDLTHDTPAYSTTELGGIGPPNEARAEFALIAAGVFHRTSGDEAVQIASNNADVKVVEGWVAKPIPDDGYYEFYLFKLPFEEVIPGSPATGEIIYDYVASIIKKYNGASWDTITADDLVSESGLSQDVEEWLDVAYGCRTKKILLKDITSLLKMDNINHLWAQHDHVKAMIQGAWNSFKDGEQMVAQKKLETLKKWINKNCKT